MESNVTELREALADIVAEMRKQANEPTIESLGEVFPPIGTEDVKDWADRIEAAAKRERERAEARQLNECVVVREEEASEWRKRMGNAAAMRKALEYVLQFDATDEAAEEDGLTDAERIAEYADHIEECQKKARAALSAPARNCDAGTAEEQAKRFKKFCFDHQAPWHGCTNCPVLMSEKCALAWAQMPYEEGNQELGRTNDAGNKSDK